MSETDEFQYDSIVSDPGVYTGFLDTTTTAATSNGQRPQQTNSSSLLTPVATDRAQTPPPRHDNTHDYGGINDSTPSLAVSTPNSEKFHLEFEHERMNYPQLSNTSIQSQFGLKSGIYNNRPTDDINGTESTTDFSAK
ncbi:hypothetical protein GGI21_005576 [Coemansia aciculifera]|uniref:Uncharacterized protein n=1 Tax=Coemansia aciculifera TaxID=417176 RepID=A0ACC1M1G5_9FUNG|nr:hypothetical protein IWW38_003172 [Coemansia aciculifera]KAJ2892584.1 hypothetical protein GGI21_005576 [Coemansia aciculifera]